MGIQDKPVPWIVTIEVGLDIIDHLTRTWVARPYSPAMVELLQANIPPLPSFTVPYMACGLTGRMKSSAKKAYTAKPLGVFRKDARVFLLQWRLEIPPKYPVDPNALKEAAFATVRSVETGRWGDEFVQWDAKKQDNVLAKE